MPMRSVAVIVFALFCVAADKPSKTSKIVVLPVKVVKGTKLQTQVFDEAFLAAVQNSANVSAIGKSDLDAVLGFEKQKEVLGCDDTKCLAEIGGALGADRLIDVQITKTKSGFSVVTKIINVVSAPVVEARRADQVPGDEETLFSALPALVRALMKAAGFDLKELQGSGTIGERPTDWQPTDAAATVVMRFESDPPGAIVVLDGDILCETTPCQKSIPLGSHRLSVQKEGFSRVEQAIVAKQDAPPVRVKLDAALAHLSVTSKPPGIEVLVDGKSVGQTPLVRYALAPGAYEVLLKDGRYYAQGERLVLKLGEHRQLDYALVAKVGALTVTATDPRGDDLVADVFVDGEKVGRTPYSARTVIGRHTVLVKSAESGSFTTEVEIAEKQQLTVKALLQRETALAAQTYQLKNGLRVILHQDASQPFVTVQVVYHVGSGDDPDGGKGMAHLFEHLMFQGSRNVAGAGYFDFVRKAGGSANGFTTGDATTFFARLPAHEIALGLWLESDRMGSLMDRIDDATLVNQIDVVKNEYRQRFQGGAAIAHVVQSAALFPSGHPAHAATMGVMADLERLKLGHARRFFRTYYTPANATLTIAGDFDADKTKPLIEQYFASLKGDRKPERAKPKPPPVPAQAKVGVQSQQTLVHFAWAAPGYGAPNRAELDVLAAVLNERRASVPGAQSVNVSFDEAALASHFTIAATAASGVSAATLDAALDEALGRVTSFTEKEVHSAKLRLETDRALQLERLEQRAQALDLYDTHFGSTSALNTDLARLRDVTPQTVAAALSAELPKSRRLQVWADPTQPAYSAPPAGPEPAADANAPQVMADDAFRKQPPPPLVPRPTVLPAIRSTTLPNGLTLLVLELPNLPLVAVRLTDRAGAVVDPKATPGLAAFAHDVLAAQPSFARALADLGATPGSEVSRDGGSLSVVCAKRVLEPALQAIAAAVKKPVVDAATFSTVRNKRGKAPSLAGAQAIDRLYEQAFGEGSPYGHPIHGTAKSTEALTEAAVSSFFARELVPANSALVVAGDITLAEAQKLATAAFGEWKGPPAPKHDRTAKAARGPNKVYPGAGAQSAIAGGLVIPLAGDDEAAAIDLGVHALGGSFGSRLNMNLRENKGISYGTNARLAIAGGAALLQISSAVRADSTGVALREITKELAAIASDKAPSDAEIATARNELRTRTLDAYASVSVAAATAASLFAQGQPLDRHAKLLARRDRTTAADVQRALAKYLRSALTFAIVGDPAQVTTQAAAVDLTIVEAR